MSLFSSLALPGIKQRTPTTAVHRLQEGLPARTVLICPSALQFLDVSLGRPMRKISPQREPAAHLKNDSLHSLSSPGSPRSSDTHSSSLLLSPLTWAAKFATVFLSHAFWVTHTHTLGASLWRERKREEEIVRGGHSWRNVSSVTVTFDGDECASFLAAASRPSGFAASASQFPDEEQQVLHEDPKMILKSCLLRWCVFELLVKCASHWGFFL